MNLSPLRLNINHLLILIAFLFFGCNHTTPIELISLSNLNKFNLKQYEKEVAVGYNYYLLPKSVDYLVNNHAFPRSEIDFVKYKEQSDIYLVEAENPRRSIGYVIDLISSEGAKKLLENLRAHADKQFKINAVNKVDFGYDFKQKTIKKFNRTLIWIIREDEKAPLSQNQFIKNFQQPNFSKTIKQAYYQLDFSALLCKFEVKVNDIEILTMNVDGQTSTDIPINAAIFGSGLQKIEVKGFPLDGTKSINPAAYIRYKVIEQEVGTGKFLFVKDFENYQTSAVKEGMPFIYHTSNFSAAVPYELDAWKNLRNLKDLKTAIKPALIKVYQKIIQKAKDGDYKALVDVIKVVESRNAKTMYLNEHDTYQRIKSILDDIADGFEIMDLAEGKTLTYAANGRLVRFIRPDGNSAFVLKNNKTNQELVLDFWFCLPDGSQELAPF